MAENNTTRPEPIERQAAAPSVTRKPVLPFEPVKPARLMKMDPASPSAFLRPFGCTSVLTPTMALDARRRRKHKETVLPPIHPNVGITAAYRRKLTDMLDQMHAAVMRAIKPAYRENEPIIAQDAKAPKIKAVYMGGGKGVTGSPWGVYIDGQLLRKKDTTGRGFKTQAAAEAAGAEHVAGLLTPAAVLQQTINDLAEAWYRNFDAAAPALADYFGKAVRNRSDRALMAGLDKAGITVKFQMTPAMRDIAKATVEQNIALIKTIPEKYLADVQGAVMRSVQTGRDLGALAKELEHNYGVSKRRAAFIALDQNNRATSAMTHARQAEVGIEEAIWLHSHGGKEPRPTHLANSGKKYKVSEGWYDPAVKQYIWPGQLIRCRCVSRSVVKGFS